MLSRHRIEPCAELRRWVKAIDLESSGPPMQREFLYAPRLEASILVRWSKSGEAIVSVLGPLTRAKRKSFVAPPRLVQVMLHPGQARVLFGVPVHELADQVVPIDDVWGNAGARLRGALARANPSESVRVLQRTLLTRLRVGDAPLAPHALVASAMRHLDDGAPRVASVAKNLHVSARHLRRLFQDELGMTPKRYARLVRLRRVLSQRRSATGWMQLAHDAGFVDQSHLIREFRDLLQTTPTAFRAAPRG